MGERGIPFLKGHGTENDFVVLPDPDREIDLTPALVSALCDRHAGIGADGVLRVVRAAADPEGAAMAGTADWFMDYRNADGGLAETCGNGIRVFARYLQQAGLAGRGRLPVATRAGVVNVWLDGGPGDGEDDAPGDGDPADGGPAAGGRSGRGDITVDMGVPLVQGEAAVRVGAMTYEGTRVSTGNPHLVVVTETPVAVLPVEAAPGFEAADFPDGVNVELVNVLDGAHLRMRVHERGSGETRSCGTGACAAAVAVAHARSGGGHFTVDVLGGRLSVRWDGPGHSVFLTGPAVIVARGEWLGRADR